MNFKNLNCRWIWRDNSTDSNQYVSFRQTINLTSKEARLYVCCDTNYVARLNGNVIGFGQYLANPENKFYDVLNMDKYAKIGENTLVIDVYYQGVGSSCYAPGIPGLIYVIKDKDNYIPNNGVYCRKTVGYIEGNTFNITPQLGTSFSFDASEISQFWNDVTELEFSDVLPVSIRKRPIKKLLTDSFTDMKVISSGQFMVNTESDNPADRIYSAFAFPHKVNEQPKICDNKIHINKDNTYIIIDLGGETTGYFTLELNAIEGVRIDVGFGEHLNDGRVRTKIGERSFGFTYYTKDDQNKFTHYYRRLGAKYLQLNFSNVKKPVDISYVGLLKAEYPVAESKMPILSDCLDQKIYAAAVKTLKCCMHEHYEDTPWREQSLYAMDARNQTLFGYSAFEDNNVFTKASIELIASAEQVYGYFALTAPSKGKKAIPSFTMAWLIWISEYIKYTKDRNFLLLHERKIKNLVFDLEKKLEDYILPLPKGERIWNIEDLKINIF